MSDPQEHPDKRAGRAAQRPQAGMLRPGQNQYFWLYMLMVAALLSLVFLPRAAAGDGKSSRDSAIERGEYLTTILGCGGCHTEGALEGMPYGEPLAGSVVGIAYTKFDPAEAPAVVFPSNLTSHKKYGLGRWSKRQIARAIRNGINHKGGEVITVMPWINYSLLHSRDVDDIVSYLKSLPAVAKQIPEPLPVGERSTRPYMRIGVYHFKPDTSDDQN